MASLDAVITKAIATQRSYRCGDYIIVFEHTKDDRIISIVDKATLGDTPNDIKAVPAYKTSGRLAIAYNLDKRKVISFCPYAKPGSNRNKAIISLMKVVNSLFGKKDLFFDVQHSMITSLPVDQKDRNGYTIINRDGTTGKMWYCSRIERNGKYLGLISAAYVSARRRYFSFETKSRAHYFIVKKINGKYELYTYTGKKEPEPVLDAKYNEDYDWVERARIARRL